MSARAGLVGGVPTIAALRAVDITPLQASVAVQVACGSLTSDGLGGPFFWDPTATGGDNGFSLIVPNSAPGTGRWRRSTLVSGLGGRLTLTTGVPITPTPVMGASTIFYSPFSSIGAPVGFSEVSQALSDATKSPGAAVPLAMYDMFAWQDGSTFRCTRGPAWTTAQAGVTITLASPAVFSLTAHNFYDGMPVIFTTTGALPTGLVAGTIYFVIAAGLTANAFEVSATLNGAAVNTSGSQSGVHTVTQHIEGRGTGAGTTELAFQNGVYFNKFAISNGPGALSGLYVGSIGTNAAGTVDMNFGGVGVNGGESLMMGVWNAYNQVPAAFNNFDSTNSWAYTTATLRPKNNSINNRISFVIGLPGSVIECTNHWNVANTAQGQSFAPIGIDSTTTYVIGAASSNRWTHTNAFPMGGVNVLDTFINSVGMHYALPLEYATVESGSLTWTGTQTPVQSLFSLRTRM